MTTNMERRAALRLYRTERVGPVTYRHLITQYGSASKALEAIPELARRGGAARLPKSPPMSQIERELEALNALGGRLLLDSDCEFPASLKAAEGYPPLLCVIGDASLLDRSMIAIVGARNASPNGARMALKMAQDLGEAEHVIVSGLARGIDTAAHKGALKGGTVAVLAGGVDQIYPKENSDLYHQIAQGGLVVSDMPLGTEPVARLFPKRNRIIAGLSRAVVLVEAKLQSGTLITAQHGLDYGRQIFAVPGAPYDPRAGGCNQWIREGAILVRGAKDILYDLDPGLSTSLQAQEDDLPLLGTIKAEPSYDAQSLHDVRVFLREKLSVDPISVDELLSECQYPAMLMNAALLEMELAGKLERHPGGAIALVADMGFDG